MQKYMKYILFIALIFTFMPNSIGQLTEKYEGELENFYRAEELLQKEQFSAARKEFSDFINSREKSNDPFYIKARYYEGLSALELYNNDAVEILQKFNAEFPESIYKNEINFKLGKYFFQKKKYVDALAWLNQVDLSVLEKEKQDEVYFKIGYANFQLGEYKTARNSFFNVKDSDSQYGAPALYYYSHIAYQEKSYQLALEGFEKLLTDARFKEVVPYYIAQIYYLEGDYEKVTQFAPQIMDSIDAKNSADLNHLIGDAYYKVGKYDEAVPYLETYDKLSKTSREEDYQLGYSYYKSSSYDKAIKMFDRVAKRDDKLGQVALYHIGECYLKKENFAYARTAFEAASMFDFDLKIQEDALYNYAILSYKLDYNPYDEAIEAFELYLERYPNSPRKNDVYQYLVNVYSNTKKYQEALNSLDKLPTLDIKLKSAYQIIAFNHGVELFEKSEFAKSRIAFQGVKKYPVDNEIVAKATFWTADAFYMQGDFKNAVVKYREFVSIPGAYLSHFRENAYYNIAYCYYNQEDYTQAIESFRTFTQLPNIVDREKLADGYARTGDAYYVTKRPEEAVEAYKKALAENLGEKDRILYYTGKSYGFIQGKTDKKIQYLLDIINNYPNSKYTVMSIYEIGQSYALNGEYENALRYFNQLVNDYPNNNLIIPTLIQIGDVKEKQGKYAEAESYFKRVLNEYNAVDDECADAVRKLKDLYEKQNKQDQVSQLASLYPCGGITADEVEESYYTAAYLKYSDSLFRDAIPEIKKYLNTYPQGKYNTEMMSYLANSQLETGDTDAALLSFEKVLALSNNPFTEDALIRTSKIYYNRGDYEKALPFYSRLEKIASSPSIIYNTKVGLMRTNYLLGIWNNALVAASDVLADSKTKGAVELEGNYISGMSLNNLNRYDDAIPFLNFTVNNTGKIIGAEAKFTIAEIYYKQEDYTESEKQVRALLKMKPSYDYWVAKALILQTRTLIAIDDLFQAEYTLSSLIQNYPVQDDGIMDEANALMDELQQLKDKPKSVPEQGDNIIEMNGEGGNNE